MIILVCHPVAIRGIFCAKFVQILCNFVQKIRHLCKKLIKIQIHIAAYLARQDKQKTAVFCGLSILVALIGLEPILLAELDFE